MTTDTERGRLQSRRLLRAPRDNQLVAIMLGVTLLFTWTWWALSAGAFFGTVLLPGAVLLYVVLALSVGLARLPIASRGPHALALGALVALAAWTALSILWTPAQDLAFDYAQRTFVYAAAFAAGLALTVALRQRMILSVAPLIAAGAIVTVVVLVRIWAETDIASLIDEDGTLDYPFGYRNANAGFFAMVALGSVALAARPRTGAPWRIALAALAVAGVSLATVSQSRGSLIAVAVGIVVLLIVAPWRGRAALALAITLAPVALSFGELLDPFDAANTDAALAELQGGALAAVVAGAMAALLTSAWCVLEHRGFGDSLPRPSRRSKLIAGAVTSVIAVIAVIAVASGPIAAGVDAVTSGDTDYGEVEGSRFTYGGGLGRADFWRVSLIQAGDDPLLGGGAGSFRARYLLEREATNEPRNAHSVWLEILGELGFVGLGLLVLSLVAAIAGALRARRLGPESAALSTVALTVGAVWLAQASLDWSWFFGGLTAPAFALLGSATAAAALSFDLVATRTRISLTLAVVVLTLVALPTFASERLALSAARGWQGDLEGAYGALSTATDLNPFADVPLLIEAEIARQSGDLPRALAALDLAQEREPDDWRSYLIGARALRSTAPEDALAQVNLALRLNPGSEELRSFRSKLQRSLETPAG